MIEPNRPERNPNKFMKYFALFMGLLYPALGLFIFFSGPELHLDPSLKKILGGVLIAYGVIRGVRTYQQYFKKSGRSRHED